MTGVNTELGFEGWLEVLQVKDEGMGLEAEKMVAAEE